MQDIYENQTEWQPHTIDFFISAEDSKKEIRNFIELLIKSMSNGKEERK